MRSGSRTSGVSRLCGESEVGEGVIHQGSSAVVRAFVVQEE